MRLQQVLSVVKPLMLLLVLSPAVIRSQNHCPTHGVNLKLKEETRLNFGFKKGELFRKDLRFVLIVIMLNILSNLKNNLVRLVVF
jgi:hypothetical protein